MKHNQRGFGIVEAMIILLVISGIIIAGVYTYQSKHKSNNTPISSAVKAQSRESSVNTPTRDQAVTLSKNFIIGMQNDDKSKVDNLMSPSFKSTIKTESGTESFYDSCVQIGAGVDSCLASFKAFDLSKVTADVIDSSAEVGSKGKTVTLSANSTLGDKLVNIGYDFHLSPNGNGWQIDNIQESRGSPN